MCSYKSEYEPKRAEAGMYKGKMVDMPKELVKSKVTINVEERLNNIGMIMLSTHNRPLFILPYDCLKASHKEIWGERNQC